MLLSPRTKPRQSQNWEGASSSTNKLAHVGQSRGFVAFSHENFLQQKLVLYNIIISYYQNTIIITLLHICIIQKSQSVKIPVTHRKGQNIYWQLTFQHYFVFFSLLVEVSLFQLLLEDLPLP